MLRWRSERGAAAVEFALVLPILLTLVLGTIEFGRAYNAQISVTHAAREAARTMAVQGAQGPARTAARTAAVSLDPALTDSQIAITPATCPAGATATVTIDYSMPSITGFFGKDVDVTGKAAMRCGG